MLTRFGQDVWHSWNIAVHTTLPDHAPSTLFAPALQKQGQDRTHVCPKSSARGFLESGLQGNACQKGSLRNHRTGVYLLTSVRFARTKPADSNP